MNKRHTLGLIEMAVMLVVFALAAALCLRLFAWADRRTGEIARNDAALVQMQNAAETLRHCGGDFAAAAEQYGGSWDGSRWIICRDDYQIILRPEATGVPCLGGAAVEAVCGGECFLSLTLRWQEVDHGS